MPGCFKQINFQAYQNRGLNVTLSQVKNVPKLDVTLFVKG